MIKVACAIIYKDDKILCVQRNAEKARALKWEFPGGKINYNERDEDCIIREIKEELHVTISINKKLNSIQHRYSDIEIELIPFHCSIIDGDIKLTEHERYLWLKKEELQTIDFCDADLKVIAELQNTL